MARTHTACYKFYVLTYLLTYTAPGDNAEETLIVATITITSKSQRKECDFKFDLNMGVLLESRTSGGKVFQII